MFLPVIGKLDLRLLHHRLGSHGRKIVAVQSDVERAHGDLSLFDAPDHLPQALGQEHSAAADSDQAKIARRYSFQ